MKEPFEVTYQKYYAQGRVVIKTIAPQELGAFISGAFLIPGIVTVQPLLDNEKYAGGLVAKNIPQDVARKIANRLQINENEAYFVPDKESPVRLEADPFEMSRADGILTVRAENPPDSKAPNKTRSSPLFKESGGWRSSDRAMKSMNVPEEQRVEVVLDSIARQECMMLGADIGSPIYESLRKVSRQAWLYGRNQE